MLGAMKAKFGICTAIATIIFNMGVAPFSRKRQLLPDKRVSNLTWKLFRWT
jgi:hypothetical protein